MTLILLFGLTVAKRGVEREANTRLANAAKLAQETKEEIATREKNKWKEIREAIVRYKVRRVQKFCVKYPKSPCYKYASYLVDIADKYKIDFRIMPAIMIAEQSGGCGNWNCFGYSLNGYARIGTDRRTEIRFIAYQLANGLWARYKNPIDKLIAWNGKVTYSAIGLFKQI